MCLDSLSLSTPFEAKPVEFRRLKSSNPNRSTIHEEKKDSIVTSPETLNSSGLSTCSNVREEKSHNDWFNCSGPFRDSVSLLLSFRLFRSYLWVYTVESRLKTLCRKEMYFNTLISIIGLYVTAKKLSRKRKVPFIYRKNTT